MDTLADDLNSIEEQMEAATRKTVLQLHSILVRVAPVDTGFFRRSWRVKQLGKLKWRITNNAEYASILWRGRRKIGNREYGSEDWPNGGDPLLAKANRDLERKYKKIRA